MSFALRFTLLTLLICAFSGFGQSDYYWVGGTGNWSNYSSHWATSSGGNIFHTTTPSSNDNVIFDSNSFSANSQTVTLNADNESVGNMTWLGVTNTPTFNIVPRGGDARVRDGASHAVRSDASLRTSSARRLWRLPTCERSERD